jgi:hypothetical protein
LGKQRRFLAIMEEKRIPYKSGFKLTRSRLDTIQYRLTYIMKRVADEVIATFTLKYINGDEAQPQDIDAVVRVKNGGERTIKALTLTLVGTQNNERTVSISLSFVAEPGESIVFVIWSNDDTWYDTFAFPLLGTIMKEIKKESISYNINILSGQVSGWLRSATIFPFTYRFAGNVADFILRLLGESFLSFDYVFYWGDAVDAFYKRQHIITKIIEVVVVAILIGLIVSVVGGLIANYITLYILHWKG